MVSKKRRNVILALLSIVLVLSLIVGNHFYKAPERKFEKTKNLMDTDVTIKVYGSDEKKCKNAIQDAFMEIERIETISNRFNETSELSRLNKQGKLDNPSEELKKLIEISKHYYNITDGAFDITIVPLLNLWSNDHTLFKAELNHKKHLNTGKLPKKFENELRDYKPSLGNLSENPNIKKTDNVLGKGISGWTIQFKNQRYFVVEKENHLEVFTKFWFFPYETQEKIISQTKKSTGSDNIEIRNSSIYLKNDVKLSLDGISKGYSVDAAMKILKKKNINRALINAGGDIATLGTPPNKKSWIIGLRNPENKTQSITELKLSGDSIATSGNYERYFNKNASVGHIMDPRTGRSPKKLSSATIIAENCTEADVLSTASFVLGPKKAKNLIESKKDAEGIFLSYDNPRNIIKTSGIVNYETEE